MIFYAVATFLGSIFFKLISKISFKKKLSMALIFFAVGDALIVGTGTYWVSVVGVFIARLGSGLFVPTLVTQILGHIPFEQRGRGTGRWQLCFFLGSFLSPLVVLGVNKATGSLSISLLFLAGAAMLAAMLAFFISNKAAEPGCE
jgi:MFS family permease